MLAETYKGRKLQVKKGGEWGSLRVTVNGQLVAAPTGRDEASAMTQLRREVDWIDERPVDGDRRGAWWYAPGTYEMCGKDLHPVALGGQCKHFTCKRERTGGA